MTYRRGSNGPEVALLQGALKAACYYAGPIDGVFGGGTESAVRSFQVAMRLPVDGAVDAVTWQELVGVPVCPPVLASRPLPFRVLALTGSFETSMPPPECFAGLSGDVDGRGLSLGALQWSLGHRSLQPLLTEMLRRHEDVLREVYGPHINELLAMLCDPLPEQLTWARSVQSPRHGLFEPWRGLLKTLGRTPQFQVVQQEAAEALYHEALNLCGVVGFASQRAVALIFDILVQQGCTRDPSSSRMLAEPWTLSGGPSPGSEVHRLTGFADRQAAAINPRRVVRDRLLTIATGQGMVHGSFYDLASSYGITLAPAA